MNYRSMVRFACLVATLLLSISPAAMADDALRNRLADHPSPYLALHGKDPVAWQTWGPEVFERARSEDRLIYLSIGYFSCHWCHVMQQESYRDGEVARWLNRHFIPVKIDRELDEALDARMIDFAERTRGRAGWPLNVFLTPEGYPLYAEMYLPRDDFLSLLHKIQDLWGSDPDGLRALVAQEAATDGGPLPVHDWTADGIDQLLRQSRGRVLANADLLQGGFGQAQKFPNSPQLRFLLHAWRLQPGDELKEFLLTTLDQMASRGLYDHIGGGFFRYTTDPDWHTPHFEKMLYDNARLALVYLEAARLFSRPVYRRVALDVLAFMRREMSTPSGAFIASLSAVDDHNVEGGYYLWTRDELSTLLNGEEAAAVQAAWVADGAPRFDAGYLLFWQDGMEAMEGMDTSRRTLLEHARRKLLEARSTTRRLPVDDKQLAGWNGLALETWATAARETGDKGLAGTARGVRDYLLDVLWRDGRLLRAVDASGREVGRSTLADYAAVISGMLAFYRLSGSEDDLNAALDMARSAWRQFSSDAGWLHGVDELLPPTARQPIVMDGALPSPSAQLLGASCMLVGESGDEELLRRVRQAAGWGRQALTENPFWHASHVQALSGPCRSMIVPGGR